jgi:drug/metabolite transporter (DMT)-like permease
VAVLLGLLVAVSYGAADFLGGFSSKRAPAAVIVLQTQILGLVLIAVLVLAIPDQHVIGADLMRGAGAGAGALLGLVLLYRGLAAGAMSIVAPIAAIGAAVLPFAWGLATGERPGALAVVGVGTALVAVALVAAPSEHGPPIENHRRELTLALIAGAGFGAVFILFGDTAKASGLWPLMSSRLVSTIVLLIVLSARRTNVRVRGGTGWTVAGTAVLDVAANAMYLVGARIGLVSLVAVLSSLYPASTVLLARIVLDERVTSRQAAGLALAVVGVVLIAAA